MAIEKTVNIDVDSKNAEKGFDKPETPFEDFLAFFPTPSKAFDELS